MSDEPKRLIEDILESVSPVNSTEFSPPEQDAVSADEVDAENRSREFVLRNQQKHINQLLRQEKDEHELRKTYIRSSFMLVVGVTFLALSLTAANGLRLISLSDSVIITLLTTTTANVIGILLIAFNWLFPKR